MSIVMKCQRWAVILFLIAVFSGCTAAVEKSKTDTPYEARILIGQRRNDVLAAAQKVFGEPKQQGHIFPQSDYEVELRRYRFTNVSDFVMYFHKDIFIQAGLMPVDSPEYPSLRSDYQKITSNKPGPVLGYTIFMDEDEVILDTIQP